MGLSVDDFVLIYKNQFDVLFSEAGTLSELQERKVELNKTRFFTAWIVQVKELPTEKQIVNE